MSLQADLSIPQSCFILLTGGGRTHRAPRNWAQIGPADMGLSSGATASFAPGIVGMGGAQGGNSERSRETCRCSLLHTWESWLQSTHIAGLLPCHLWGSLLGRQREALLYTASSFARGKTLFHSLSASCVQVLLYTQREQGKHHRLLMGTGKMGNTHAMECSECSDRGSIGCLEGSGVSWDVVTFRGGMVWIWVCHPKAHVLKALSPRVVWDWRWWNL
jgi:hypothetical protein